MGGNSITSWNARNQLISISGNVTATFSYDAVGRRISKTINGTRTDYQYDGKDIVAEIGGGSAVNATYVRSLNIDEPFARITSSGQEFYHTDALGSVFSLTDAYGNTTASYTYDPFGNTTQSGISTNPFQYTGREQDSTGLTYYRARYYSPALQRFISEDPIGLAGADENFYVYIENSPVNFYDPLGLSKWYPVPGQPGWEVRRDQPHTSKDYYHEHYRKRGKEVARKVDSKKGCQKKHGEGIDKDVPKEVIDATKKAFSVTGDVGIDLGLLEGFEAANDFLTDLGKFIPPPPPGIGIPGFSGVPVTAVPVVIP